MNKTQKDTLVTEKKAYQIFKQGGVWCADVAENGHWMERSVVKTFGTKEDLIEYLKAVQPASYERAS